MYHQRHFVTVAIQEDDSDCSGSGSGSHQAIHHNVFLTREPRDEPINNFLARLVPTQTTSAQGAWIYTDSPEINRPSDTPAADWPSTLATCTRLLSALSQQLSTPNPATGRPPTLAHQRQLRQATGAALQSTAAQHHATIGKWILFYPATHVDQAWKRVATATANGRLGVAAKVNTTSPDHANGSRTYVICVYTHDFRDRDDVRRVLVELFRLGLTPPGLHFGDAEPRAAEALPSASCSWKPDLFTYLGIDTGNPWGITPTLYRWQEFLPPKASSISHSTPKQEDAAGLHKREKRSASTANNGDASGGVVSKRSKTAVTETVVMVEGVDF